MPPGPFDDLQVSDRFDVDGLSGPVHVARDIYGVAHIHATTIGDAGFAQGYVMAHDRLPQMDILRRFGAGTLGELFGGLDQGVVETDLEMRMHRMKPIAEEALAMLRASSDARDVEIVALLDGFAAGVNRYAADLVAGRWQLDDAISSSFDPERFVEWSPVDSLVLGRFQAFALSWTTPFEIDLTELYQGLRETFDAASTPGTPEYQRRGISADVMRIVPVGRVATIDGFPNVDPDTGTRSDAGRPGKRGAPAAVARPHVPRDLLVNARKFFKDTIRTGPFGALGPHAFMAPHAGSNNWAVAPSLAGGKALLATDQHLNLPNPSIFYPTHIILADPTDGTITLDLIGITFPGIPGVVLGTNGKVAWSATVSYHDVNDVYLEQIAPCPTSGGDCVTHLGEPVPIETWTETINLGVLGTPTSSITATYERVPHHGPIIPTIVDGAVVPRTSSSALSVAYTGHAPTIEIRAVYGLAQANTVDDGFAALADFHYGSQNWTMIDNSGNIGWSTHAKVPLREPTAYTWNATVAPDAPAPFFVLPGDGGGDWQGYMDARYIPHAINPAQGYIVTANSDPVGATFDGDPLNQAIVDGRPLYAGVSYAAGLRTERIATRIADGAGAGALDLADMASIQHDNHSTMGAKLRDGIVAMMAVLDSSAGQPADAVAYVAGLSPADRTRLLDARTRLAAWTFATPQVIDGGSLPGDLADSAATAQFNAWMHYFIEGVFGDEMSAIGLSPWFIDSNLLVRAVYSIFYEEDELVQSAVTDQPVICDRMATPMADGSCTTEVLVAMLAALDHLASPAGFGSADPATWWWGTKHRLVLEPLFPNSALELPSPSDPPELQGGYPKAGDNFNVNRSDMGYADLDFQQFGDGPAQRFMAEASAGAPISVKWQLPGGTIYNRSSHHYRDLLDNHYIAQQHFDAPIAIPDIVSNGEDRWVFY